MSKIVGQMRFAGRLGAKSLITACLYLFISTVSAEVSDSLKGAYAYANGDYETALQIWTPLEEG